MTGVFLHYFTNCRFIDHRGKSNDGNRAVGCDPAAAWEASCSLTRHSKKSVHSSIQGFMPLWTYETYGTSSQCNECIAKWNTYAKHLFLDTVSVSVRHSMKRRFTPAWAGKLHKADVWTCYLLYLTLARSLSFTFGHSKSRWSIWIFMCNFISMYACM